MTEDSAALELYDRLSREAAEGGYNLNPDKAFVMELMDGLVVNQGRYGYPSCPCRLAEEQRKADLDMICPCDYRDPDLAEFGACYCGLYVSEAIARGEKQAQSIPDRRPVQRNQLLQDEQPVGMTADGIPVWRCRVCGYLCARTQPPLKCPVCKVDRDRFERFGWGKEI